MAKHIHQYVRVNIGTGGRNFYVMKCVSAGCKHYTIMRTKLSCPLLIGKTGICNRCDESFELDRRSLRMAEPCCLNCVKTKGKKKEKIQEADKFFEELLEGIK